MNAEALKAELASNVRKITENIDRAEAKLRASMEQEIAALVQDLQEQGAAASDAAYAAAWLRQQAEANIAGAITAARREYLMVVK